VKEEQGVKMEDVDQPTATATQVKQEIQVKQEPVDAGATPMDVSAEAAPAAPASAVKTEATSSPIASCPVSLPLPAGPRCWRPPDLVALLPGPSSRPRASCRSSVRSSIRTIRPARRIHV
jgi:hypothetical protein